MPSSSRSGSIGQCPIHATEILFVNVFFLFTIINILFLLIKVFFRGAEYASACQHCSKALFLPGTFTRFTRFLNDFTWFCAILHDFYTILRDFCDFYAIFCQAQIFCCQAPKTILHPCHQHRPRSDAKVLQRARCWGGGPCSSTNHWDCAGDSLVSILVILCSSGQCTVSEKACKVDNCVAGGKL